MQNGDLIQIAGHLVWYRLIDREPGPHPHEAAIVDLVYVETNDGKEWFPESWVTGVRSTRVDVVKPGIKEVGMAALRVVEPEAEREPTE